MPGFRSDLYGMGPGLTAASEQEVRQVSWGRYELAVITGVKIAGAARDSGNTPTTVLRPGLVLGKITSSGEYTNYSPTATDGSSVAVAVLISSYRMQDLDGTNTDRFAYVLVGGPVRASVLPNLDKVARSQMRGRFFFDDDFVNQNVVGHLNEVHKTADYVVLASDQGTLFTNTGDGNAINFTLPTLAAGIGPYEFLAVADFSLTVTSAAGNDIITSNDVSASSLAFSTAGDIIGGRLRLRANAAGTKWHVEKLSPNAMTIT